MALVGLYTIFYELNSFLCVSLLFCVFTLYFSIFSGYNKLFGYRTFKHILLSCVNENSDNIILSDHSHIIF